MKKKLFFGLAGVVLALVLTGLIWFVVTHLAPQKPLAASVPTEVGTTAPTAEAPSDPVAALAAISLPIVEKEFTADDGTVIFTYASQDLVLTLSNAEIAKKVQTDLANRMEAKSTENPDELFAAADLQYTGQETWTPFFYKNLYSPTRVDNKVLSLYGLESHNRYGKAYTNGNSATYDLVSGQILTLQNVLSEESGSADRLQKVLLQLMNEQKEALGLDEDFEGTVKETFPSLLLQDDHWFFTDSGLSIFFSPSTVAGDSVGIVTVPIPYSQLNGILRDTYFPEDAPILEGDVQLLDFADADFTHLTAFCELFASTSEDISLLQTTGLITGITVEQGGLVYGHYVTDSLIFHANRLTDTDGLMLRLPRDSEVLWTLRFSMGGKAYAYDLGYSEDGALILTPKEETA